MIAAPFRFAALLSAGLAGATLLAGCHVTTNKHGNKDNVDIGTPFGSMSVKTDDNAVNSNLGLSAYPGAVPVHDKGDNGGAADVNMSFGNFHLGVVARSYQTTDSVETVTAFYRKDLARYGDSILCDGSKTVGTPTRTSQGLTCVDGDKNHINASSHSDGPELRSGSPTHQHIVAIEPKDGGTRIGLVKIDLPTGLNSHDEKESE